MRFLLHGNLTPAVGEAVERHGHKTATAGSLHLTEMTEAGEVLKAAGKAQVEILTADSGLIDAVYAQKLQFARTIVFLQLSGGEVEQDDAIDRLFKRYKRLAPKRMYTVTETRVKIRQLPGAL